MSQTVQKNAVSGYLADSESVQDTYSADDETEGSVYFLTDRRLLKLQQGGSNPQAAGTFRSIPLDDAREVEISKVEGEDFNPEHTLAALIFAAFGVLGLVIPFPESVNQLMVVAGITCLAIGLAFGVSAVARASDGHISVEIGFPSKNRSLTLTPDAEDFSKSISSIVGSHQQ